VQEEKEEEEEVAPTRARWVAIAGMAAAISLLPASPAGSEMPPQDAQPGTVVTLDRGQLWGTPWEVIAYRNEEGLWCETLLRNGVVITCVNLRPEPRPIQVTAAFHRRGPNPTTIAVVGTSGEVARVRLKLVPGQEPLMHRVRPLKERQRRRAGLPRGFRFFVIALEKVRGVRAIDAFDEEGKLIGHDEGIAEPPDLRR
jgi:hypothetical protein